MQGNPNQFERDQICSLDFVKSEQIETPEDSKFLLMLHNIDFHEKKINIVGFHITHSLTGVDLCGDSHQTVKQEPFSECNAEGNVSCNLVLLK